MKYDYDRTDGVIKYPDRETVGDFLRQGPFDRGPFRASRERAVYSGFYIRIYVGSERVAFEDVVYSVDPDVIRTVKEFAAALNKAAVDWKADEDRKAERAKAAKEDSRRSLFAAAAKKWKR